MSSWMVRLAFANGYPLHTFYACLLGYRGSIWNRDVDRHPPPPLLNILAHHTGQSTEALYSMTLAAYEGVIFEHLPHVGNAAWILPVGVFHRTRRRAGLQFCPRCLEDDLITYYRRSWRLALCAMCERHLCVMQENCPKCKATIAFYRHGIGRGKEISSQNLRLCHMCGFDLSQAPSFIPDWPDIRSLNNFKKIIGQFECGYWPNGSNTSYFGIPYFHGIRVLVSVINGRNGLRLRHQLSRAIGVNIVQGSSRSGLDFEYLTAAERLSLLLAVTWLMDEWPARFVDICSEANFTRSRLAEEVSALPFWLAQVADDFLDNRLLLPSSQEVMSACTYLMSSQQEVSPQTLGSLLGLSRDSAKTAYRRWKVSVP
jgi:hypothetical protein